MLGARNSVQKPMSTRPMRGSTIMAAVAHLILPRALAHQRSPKAVVHRAVTAPPRKAAHAYCRSTAVPGGPLVAYPDTDPSACPVKLEDRAVVHVHALHM